ncbi:MAG: stealth family protein [Huintestinicola sp.]
MIEDSAIDFVIIWVDGSDPEWQAEKAKYVPTTNTDSRPERYRDWGLLPYWFRGVEKFAPWVRRIHFVTWGHIPNWLDTSHPKLNIVRHEDYIPGKYLPTFSANPIELNLHRIEGLTENFVFFNDDTFITAPVRKQDFFRNGLPCDSAVLNVHCYAPSLPIQMIAINDTGLINEHFDIKKTIKAAPFKWLNPLYGKYLLRTVPLMFCPRFPGFYQPHFPNSIKRSTMEEVWNAEYDMLDRTCMNRFRSAYDVNQWVFREWQLAANAFVPRSCGIGQAFYPDRDGKDEFSRIGEYISKQKKKLICINDCELSEEEFRLYSGMLADCFRKILPEKSGFEK